MYWSSLICLLFSLHLVEGEEEDILVNRNIASSFHGLSKRGLNHECYSEHCEFEEVREVYPNSYETRMEYWYNYRCWKDGYGCKVACVHRKNCDLLSWSSWNGVVGSGYGCYTQTRYKPFKYSKQTTHQRFNCNGLTTSCPTLPEETRKVCVCRSAVCTPTSWSAWTPDVVSGKCVTQTRKKPYSTSIVSKRAMDSCNGIQTNCSKKFESQTRRQCNCKYQECKYLGWGEWKGEIPEEGCTTQVRTKESSQITHLKLQPDNCDGLNATCSLPERKETRKMCNCKYREDCSFLEWSEWRGDEVKRGSCSFEIRVREFNKSVIVKQQLNNCDGLPKRCAVVDKEETRSRCRCLQRHCNWTNWFKDGIDEATKCQRISRVRNITASTSEAEAFGNCDNVVTNCDTKETVKQCGQGEIVVTARPDPVTVTPSPITEKPEPVVTKYIPLGCFKDKQNPGRALPQLIKNLRSSIDWYNMKKTVQGCVDHAARLGYSYVAVQFYGECWSGEDSLQRYNVYGRAKSCWEGVGEHLTNFVYKIVQLPESACVAKLQYKASVSSGHIKNGVWCTDDQDTEPQLTINFDTSHKVTGLSTKGHDEDSFVTVYGLSYLKDDGEMEQYKEGGVVKHFTEDSNRFTEEFHFLKNSIQTKTLVLRPKTWQTRKLCMDIAVFGCTLG